jgi:hypothetical protein
MAKTYITLDDLQAHITKVHAETKSLLALVKGAAAYRAQLHARYEDLEEARLVVNDFYAVFKRAMDELIEFMQADATLLANGAPKEGSPAWLGDEWTTVSIDVDDAGDAKIDANPGGGNLFTSGFFGLEVGDIVRFSKCKQAVQNGDYEVSVVDSGDVIHLDGTMPGADHNTSGDYDTTIVITKIFDANA